MKSLRRSMNNGNGHSHSHSHSNSQGQTYAGPSQNAGYPQSSPYAAGPSAMPMPGPVPTPGVNVFSNPLSRPADKVAPPQKVIKAQASHRSTNPQELSYQKGDFWYVTGERDGWYEALSKSCCRQHTRCRHTDPSDPITGSRGLVPKRDFEEFIKGGRQASASERPGASGTSSPTASSNNDHQRSQSQGMPASAMMRSPNAPVMLPTSAPTTPGGKRGGAQPCVVPGIV